MSETDSLNLNSGRPFSAIKRSPSSSNSTNITDPALLPETSSADFGVSVVAITLEFLKIDV